MIEEDMTIIDSSLQFVNDLLRNILDMHRANSNQMKIEMEPVNLLCDVLEPVASMLYQRGSDFEVLLECPSDLVVMTDKLRLKQTCLNLGRNATKFVNHGFVRLRADIVNDKVHVFVEDSGSGVPLDKRDHIFGKFQETRDSLSQGTGIGLSLCKKLVELMRGTLCLEVEYDSGVDGCPGACFAINLNTHPIPVESLMVAIDTRTHNDHQGTMLGNNGIELPEGLSILFVDDDWKLRTLCSRAIRRVSKGWTIREAANGETALRLAEEQKFDIIFMDQYMSSVVKQLLGTETIQALRSRGVTSAICGLSANDLTGPFLGAGADIFLPKPLPAGHGDLVDVLFEILSSTGTHTNNNRVVVRNPSPKTPVATKSFDGGNRAQESNEDSSILPKHLSLLVVDDDPKVRQLFVRALRRAMPGWTMEEAHDGDSAMQLAETNLFDLIFLDQHMPTPQKTDPIKGTDVARALRSKGISAIVCGLSANDCESLFLEAGADCFHVKPFPCEKEALCKELVKILGLDDDPADAARVCLGVKPKTTGNPENAVWTEEDLPATLSVLYVDDSPSLRKLFTQSLQRAAPRWSVQVAENGEAALQMVDSHAFDLIFFDQNMNTGLLGSDTAKRLRQKGVSSVLCGLSGDDIASTFIDAGADCFIMKPCPCDKVHLRVELKRVLKSAR